MLTWARHFTLTVPLSAQVYKWVPVNLMLGVTLRWTSIPSRGSRNILSRFMLQKLGETSSLMGALAHMQTFPYHSPVRSLVNKVNVCSCFQIFQLEEKDTQTKLEILFKKNLYAMAIRYCGSYCSRHL